MNQEVIRDFLNVPGIVGIALVSGRSEPVFWTQHPVFAKAGRNDFLKNLLQIVETIPPEYEMLEFRFIEHQIALYRLQPDLIVLVIKDSSLNSEQFISAFEALRSQVTISQTSVKLLPKLQEVIDVMDRLSHFTTQYLGVPVITNYWKSSRPEGEWLQKFQVARSGQIAFIGESSALEKSVSDLELEMIRDWVAHFIRRCSQAVRDYPALVEQHTVTDLQKALLLP
jgi:hypothetical protein